ncbi:MAG TPA: hypothetical protein VEC35_11160 [Noviherbaspirillum sp.]|nr:hypothetical protein [Noviherbaspirillum sp.]
MPGPIGGPSEPNLDPLWKAFDASAPEEAIAAHLTDAIKTILEARIPFITEEQERSAIELGKHLTNNTSADLTQINRTAWQFAVMALSQLSFTPASDMDRLYEYFGGRINDTTSALNRIAVQQFNACNELSASHTAERAEAIDENAPPLEMHVIETRQLATELAARARMRDEWWDEAKRLAPGISLPGHEPGNQ